MMNKERWLTQWGMPAPLVVTWIIIFLKFDKRRNLWINNLVGFFFFVISLAWNPDIYLLNFFLFLGGSGFFFFFRGQLVSISCSSAHLFCFVQMCLDWKRINQKQIIYLSKLSPHSSLISFSFFLALSTYLVSCWIWNSWQFVFFSNF